MPTYKIPVYRYVSLVGRFEACQTYKPAKQQRCGNFTFRSCCVSILTGLDDRGESLCYIPTME